MENQTHPIENMMKTTMEGLKAMVDVNTIVGDCVVMTDGTVVIPVSKVGFGFVSGGGEYEKGGKREYAGDKDKNQNQREIPFAGGAGAGISVSPVAFLVAVPGGKIQLMSIDYNTTYDRLIDSLPTVMQDIKDMINNVHHKNDEDEDTDDATC